MKIAVKTLVLGMCVAGATAAFATSHIGTVPMVTSHQAVIGAMPIPTCSPGAKCTGTGISRHADSRPAARVQSARATRALIAAMPIPTCSPGAKCTGKTGLIAAMPIPTCSPGAKHGQLNY
jgi:hypothetical protein